MCYFESVLTPEEVTKAIAVHGCQLSDNGEITEPLKIRLNEAARLFSLKVAPVIIVCGWRPLKRRDLERYSESEVMERYLLETYGHEPWAKDLIVLREPHSTSVPENLILVAHHFSGLQEVTIVVGELVIPRVLFFASKFFDAQTVVHGHGCNDGIGTVETERRLLGDAQCTINNLTPEELEALRTPKMVNGIYTTDWDWHRERHHKCPDYGGLHPWQL